MDKNTIIGIILIIAVVIGFTVISKPSKEELAREQQIADSLKQERIEEAKEQMKIEDSIQQTLPKEESNANSFFQIAQAPTQSNDSVQQDSATVTTSDIQKVEEKIVSLENDLIKIDFSTKGGQMVSAQLKNYKTFNDQPLYLFDRDNVFSLQLENKASIKLNTIEADFTPVKSDDSSVLTMRLYYSTEQYIDFIYALNPDSYMLKFDILTVGMDDLLSHSSKDEFILSWQQDLRRKEKSIDNEQRYSRIHYKYSGNDVDDLSDSKNDKKEINEPVKWIAFKDQFFASAIIADNDFHITDLDSKKIEASQEYLKKYSAILYTNPTVEENGIRHAGFRYFLGPLDYAMLKGYDDNIEEASQELDLDKLIPLGWSLFRWVNQYFVIPLFNLLNKTGLGVGIIILLLTIIVKLIISPLTFKSFMSSAKMRVLRPQVELINEKYPKQEQAMEKQKATMALYRQAGVNPMSGCIPMLLQMPILLALFSFFPSLIQLRGESFLWANDLSTYDAIIEWKANIPLISSWLGNHISLFCVLMTITNIVYTKFNMDATNTGQQQMPGMKWMMYLMPLIFLFVLNNYPSGLTYYYFVSTLITILLTLSFRFFVNEEKLLAKLEKNKAKPKKKSGFMARLEEAQRMQQQQAKGGGNKGNKGNKKKK